MRRFEVPDVWVQAVSLLLEPDPNLRLSVLQLLQAYPILNSGALQVLKVQEGNSKLS